MTKKITFQGECFKVELDYTEGVAAPLPRVTIFVEDDGNWFEELSFSDQWTDEVINLLAEAKGHVRRNKS